MKNYFLRAFVWVQVIIVFFALLITTGVLYIDSLFYSLLRFNFFATVMAYYEPYFSFLERGQEVYGSSALFLLFLLGGFLLLSAGIGILVAIITYFVGKKKPITFPLWMKDMLLVELISLLVVGITALLVSLLHTINYTAIDDKSGLALALLLLAGFPIFLLARLLWDKKKKGFSYLSYAVFGFLCLYGVGATVRMAMDYSYFSHCAMVREDEERRERYRQEEARRAQQEGEDYDDYSISDYDPDWDFEAFSEEDFTTILNDTLLMSPEKKTYWNIPRMDYKDTTEAYLSVFSSGYRAFHKLMRYTERDNDRIGVFWYYFGETTLEALKEYRIIGTPTQDTAQGELEDLLRVGRLTKDNAPLMEEILTVMDTVDGNSSVRPYTDQLAPVFKKYGITSFAKDMNKYSDDIDYVRWLYTFWARRYREENTEVVYNILEDIVAYGEED